MTIWKKVIWFVVAALGTGAIAVLALSRGEQISALWIIVAGLCALSISYRFYSKWLATKVLVLNDERATPAVVQNDGKDFVPTNRWMVFGHHFAAIAGPGLATFYLQNFGCRSVAIHETFAESLRLYR